MLSASLLGAIQKTAKEGTTSLRPVPHEQRNDRSAPLTSVDQVVDEEKIWETFFNSGAGAWYKEIESRTFSSTFCELKPEEAIIIVNHWRHQNRDSLDPKLLQETVGKLGALVDRLDEAVKSETSKSTVGSAFVKLSTRSPKDSKRVLALAAEAYRKRIAAMDHVDSNTKWRVLSEEVTSASAVKDGMAALHLLLDSARVFEDLEYAQRDQEAFRHVTTRPPWNVCLVARAWDPRIRLETEFRGICWNGKLTCLGQYFHPLYLPELAEQKVEIERDILACAESDDVRSAIAKLGGCCILDFARLAPGEVMVVELNPFDGVALGTFPASTGLFLWEDPKDHAIMTGKAPFEFRIREKPMEEHKLKVDFNQAWRKIIYDEAETVHPDCPR